MIHIVIPVFNRWHFTQACLQSLQQQSYTNFKIVVVDHGSTDGTSENIKKDFPEVIVLKGDESMWWTAATNLGVQFALDNKADFVLTLNNDLIVPVNYLDTIITVSKKYPNSLIGSVSVDKSNPERVMFTGINWNKWTAKYRPNINKTNFNAIQKNQLVLTTDLLPGRGTLIPSNAFKTVGLFDEKNFPHYAADEEFSNRCKKNGFQLLVSTKSVVHSEVDATGLKNIHTRRNLSYWKDLFTSYRSPVNLKRRWAWAKLNTPLPPLYFTFDVTRILFHETRPNK